MLTTIHHSLYAAAMATALLASLPAQDITAIKCGKLYVGNGKTLDNVVVLIEDGRIKQVGKDIQVSWDAKTIDASKHYVMPAWIEAHASAGMDRANENMQVTPFLTVLDSVDPSNSYFKNARRYGIGTIHVLPGNATVLGGRGMIVKPFGKTPEEMALSERAAMKGSLQPRSGSRSQHLGQFMKALDDAKDARAEHARKKKEFDEDKKNGATTAEAFEEKIDSKIQPILDLLDRKMTLYLYVPRGSDVPAALRLVQKYRLKTVFVLGSDCWKAVDLLKRAQRMNIGIVLDSALEVIDKHPVTQEETQVCVAKVFYDAGIPFALTSRSSSSRFSRFRGMIRFTGGPSHPAQSMPWWQVATCVRHGMSERAAIAAYTTIPAKILGLDKQIGTIEVGKDANFQVLSAAPLEPESQLDYLVVEGTVIYDRSKDPRVKELSGKTSSGASEGSR